MALCCTNMSPTAAIASHGARINRLDYVLLARGFGCDREKTSKFLSSCAGLSQSVYRRLRETPKDRNSDYGQEHWRRLAESLFVPYDWLATGGPHPNLPDDTSIDRRLHSQDDKSWKREVVDHWKQMLHSRKIDKQSKDIDHWLAGQAENSVAKQALTCLHRSLANDTLLSRFSEAQMAALAEAWHIPGAPNPIDIINATRNSDGFAPYFESWATCASRARLDSIKYQIAMFNSTLTFTDEANRDLSLNPNHRIVNVPDRGVTFSPISYSWSHLKAPKTSNSQAQWRTTCASIYSAFCGAAEHAETADVRKIQHAYAMALSDAFNSIYSDDERRTPSEVASDHRIFVKEYKDSNLKEAFDAVSLIREHAEWDPGRIYSLSISRSALGRHLDASDINNIFKDTTRATNAAKLTAQDNQNCPKLPTSRLYTIGTSGDWFIVHPDFPPKHQCSHLDAPILPILLQ